MGPREGHAPARHARQHPQPPRPPRPHLRRPADGRRPGRPDGLPDHGPADGPGGAPRLPVPRAGRGDPPDRRRLRRGRHGRHGLLARLRHPAHRARDVRRQPRLRDRHRHAVGRRRHRPGAAADRRGARHRPHRLRQGPGDRAAAGRAPDRRGGDRGRPPRPLAGPRHGHRLHRPALPLVRADARGAPRRDPRVEREVRRRGPDADRPQGILDPGLPALLAQRGSTEDLRVHPEPGRADRQDRGPLPAGRPGRRGRHASPATSWAIASRPTAASSGSSPSARATACAPCRSSSWARCASWPAAWASASARSCRVPRPAIGRPS